MDNTLNNRLINM